MKTKDFLLIRAAFKKPVERTPVWVMRQAGRYLSEYRNVFEKAGGFLDLCMNPEYAAEVSIQPLDLVGVDAVIMFSDILTPLIGMGVDLDFAPGPKIANPIRTGRDIENLKIPDPEKSTAYVGSLLRLLRREIDDRAPVIGFAGSPFTLASYLIEGESSKLFSRMTKLFLDEPDQAHSLMKKLTRMTIDYLNYQIESGAQMVQLFDTWAGIFSPDDFKEYIFPYVSQIFSELIKRDEVPAVYYINGGHHLLPAMSVTGADVVGLDWKTDIGEARELIGDTVALQGNLDPNVLFCKPEVIRHRVGEILSKYGPDSGHIFNLGHGINKNVDPEHLRHMVRAVKELSIRDPDSTK
ncbi:MAG: uroporphyrinogen decarboxylase [Proteobacteria bacterium]|nr:uroporphyrinogen decarboxylase [Pseudomonadota bacterium]